MVGTAELNKVIGSQFAIEGNKDFVFGAVVLDDNFVGIHIGYGTFSFGIDKYAGVGNYTFFEACTHDRGFRAQERYRLAHHVGSHERTVRVVVLQERNKGSGDGGDLVRRHIYVVHFFARDDREVPIFFHYQAFVEDISLVVHLDIGLRNLKTFFLLSTHIDELVEFYFSIFYLAVRSLYESHVVHLGIYGQRGDKTDVWSFRGFDRTKASVVSIVYVTHLKACTFAGETSRTEGRETALVGDFGQRVGLIHELGELAGTEERVDHRRKGLGIDQVQWCKDLIVTYIHTLTDGTCHTSKPYAELSRELFAYGAHTTVGKVVDIINLRFGVDKLDEILNNGDDIFLGKYLFFHRDIEP